MSTRLELLIEAKDKIDLSYNEYRLGFIPNGVVRREHADRYFGIIKEVCDLLNEAGGVDLVDDIYHHLIVIERVCLRGFGEVMGMWRHVLSPIDIRCEIDEQIRIEVEKQNG